jgi:predicted DNA-binding transcriptional regulator
LASEPSDGEPRKVGKLVLSGTTLRVYRFIYRQGTPQNIHDIQRGLDLSSPSVALYHVRKLSQAGLIREEKGEGYVVDKILFENMIRIRRSLIPIRVTYAVFFATLLGILLAIVRTSNSFVVIFVYSLAVTVAALGIFVYEVLSSLRKRY